MGLRGLRRGKRKRIVGNLGRRKQGTIVESVRRNRRGRRELRKGKRVGWERRRTRGRKRERGEEIRRRTVKESVRRRRERQRGEQVRRRRRRWRRRWRRGRRRNRWTERCKRRQRKEERHDGDRIGPKILDRQLRRANVAIEEMADVMAANEAFRAKVIRGAAEAMLVGDEKGTVPTTGTKLG